MAVFAVTYVYVADPDRLGEVRPEHRAFLRDLLAQGSLLASGPLPPTPDGEPGGALLVVEAQDPTGALTLLDPDPMRRAGLVAERSAREWQPVIGALAS
ncbi:YciI family protein [Isoptericola sp. BMS4]|uniref:YciI family protein n=1 Tax=Isoptericola sp. BMS4 TaxID=2527875 RepID=UPI001421C0B7|nr:YciI family protein [Isoptericola sp. BMS4]